MKSDILVTTGGLLPTDPDAPVLQSAHAILLLDGQYILQLRDNKPDIAAPGQWTLYKLMEGQDTGIFTYERTNALKMPWVMRETIERYHKEMILK